MTRRAGRPLPGLAVTRRHADDGSVLPLVVGAVVMVVALVTVVTDVSVLFLHRRALQATVDGAALAGAQGIDVGAVYSGGAHGTLALEPRLARADVAAYLRSVPEPRSLRGFRVTSVAVDTTTVTVTATSTASPPFLAFLTGHGVTVVARSTARTSVP